MEEDQPSMFETHKQWMARHGRVYEDDAEKERRFRIFKDNVEFIESFNSAGNLSYKLGINKFADQTDEEFRASHSNIIFKNVSSNSRSSKTMSFRYEYVSEVPSNMDWRTKGAVTPTKNQGHCGSCWAFSAVAAIEGITQLTTGKLMSLSEQEVIDCHKNERNRGCKGGYIQEAFDFVIQNQGIATEESYPYQGVVNSACNITAGTYPFSNAAMINGYETVPVNSEQSLLKAVANQPVSVCISIGEPSFRFYSASVFSGNCGNLQSHCFTIVGYGITDDGIKYWLVKISWGTGWGEEGYIRMQRDVDDIQGVCGIAMFGSYPTA